MVDSGFTTDQVSFDSEGITCAGVLYRPDGHEPPVPCVVMAHGFSGTMDWIVPDFAARFASGGLAVLIFDYRHLGASGGQPRQLISTRRQLADLRRAVQFARSRDGVDPRRIALWGTSLGGHHVIAHAVDDPQIAAVVANVPGLDLYKGIRGRTTHQGEPISRWQVMRAIAKLVAAATADAVRGALGMSPHYIQVYGRPGEAVFSDPSLADRFRDVENSAPTWRNRCTPRFLFAAPRYRRARWNGCGARCSLRWPATTT